MSEMPVVVIVGAGFGGLETAKGLESAPVKTVIIDASNYHLFQPLLYQVATAGLSPADIASPVRHILRGHRNTDIRLGRVVDVDTAKQEVITADERIRYDYLVLATGARHSYFGHPDWEKFAPGLKSISDATKIRRNILLAFEEAEIQNDTAKKEALLTFVVIGGGPTGVELAGAIAELSQRALVKEFHHFDPKSAKVILIEAGARVLGSFDEKLSAKAQGALEKLRVEVRTQTRVTRVDAEGVWTNETFIPSKTVIWAAGVVASPAGQWLKVETDKVGRVKVKKDLTVPGHENIFVIGDTALVEIDGKPLPGVSPVAMQEGRYVAKSVLRRVSGGKKIEDFAYHDKGSLATVGRKFAVADLGKIKLSGLIAWAVWLLVHIYYLIGFRNRVVVLIQWAWAYLTFQRGARLIVTSAADENESQD